MSAKPKCLVPGCKNKAFSRGLCRFDYMSAWALVKAGDTTWEELEKAGKVLPKSGNLRRERARDFLLAK
jgi:hypothetical protein